MTDITADFNIVLKSRDAPVVIAHRYALDRLDGFLQEAYSINARIADLTKYLRTIRPSYLSISAAPRQSRHDAQKKSKEPAQRHLSDTERAAIDAEAKSVLQQLHKTVAQLSDTEKIRHDTIDAVALKKRTRGGIGGLTRWAAGGAITAKSPEEEAAEAKEKTLCAYREGVIWFLQKKLEEAGQIQTGMMEIRLQREEEKNKSMLYKSRGIDIPYEKFDAGTLPKGGQNRGSSAGDVAANEEWEQQLSDEQLQLFAEENQDMLKHYQDRLGQVRAVHRSLDEIAEMQTTLVTNIELQSQHIDQLTQDSYLTTENVGRGNKELKKATQRASSARILFHSTCAFCAFLVVWDLVF